MDKLINSCLEGDPDAWDAFVERYAAVVYGAVRRVVLARVRKDPSVSIEDIAQDVFLRLLQNNMRALRSYDASRASLVTWLTIIARNVALDALRKKILPTVPVEADRDAAPEKSSPSPSATGNLPAGLLSPRQALVLRLLFDEQLEVAETARILGVAEQTVRSAKHKAMNKLRKHFGAEEN